MKLPTDSIKNNTDANNDVSNTEFKRLIFEYYHGSKYYDINVRELLNIRQTMLEMHECFNSMSVKSQFEYCQTIALIAGHSELHFHDKCKIFPTQKVYKYSINRDLK